MADLPSSEIPETEIVMLLNSNPMYRDLQNRVSMLEQMMSDARRMSCR